MPTPREIADRQLAAYNARNLDAFMALFAEEAQLIDLPSGAVTASDKAAIRALYAGRFAENPDLLCTVHARMDLGEVAIDRETVTGAKIGTVDIIAAYRVVGGLIRSVHFVRQAQG